MDSSTKVILDAPCGFGRHSIELAKRGYIVHGVDYFDSQLRIAKEKSGGIDNLSFEKADLRNFIGESFDAAINLFTSFGYFGRELDRKVLNNLIQSVRVGGTIVLDVRNPVRLIKDFYDGNWILTHTDGKSENVETYDPITSINSVVYKRNNLVKRADINIYTPAELIEWFKEGGAVVKHLHGSFSGGNYDPTTSSRLILVMQRTR